MIRIAICDDNWKDIENLEESFKELSSQELKLEIECFQDGSELISAYEQGRRYDVILLDMLMTKVNGIETAKVIRRYQEDAEIVIVTATQQFAIDGYQVNAYRYYLKPLSKQEFKSDMHQLLNQIHSSQSLFLTITNTHGITRIKLDDIYYIESMARTLTIHTHDRHLAMTGKISEMENSLKEYSFIRTHKSFIVHLKYVRNIFKDTITLDNGDRLLLSKHKSKQVHEALMSYINRIL